jgi:hypothetical protein
MLKDDTVKLVLEFMMMMMKLADACQGKKKFGKNMEKEFTNKKMVTCVQLE